MSISSVATATAAAKNVRVTDRALVVELRDGRVVSVPLAWYPLATKAAVQLEGEQTRRHFDVVAEGLRDDIRMIAEGVVSLHARVDAHRAETTGVLANHDRRLTRLETSRAKRR